MEPNLLDSKTQELLDKLKVSRDKLESYSDEMEELKKKVDDMFPKQLDYRSKWVLDEKIKTVSEFFSSLLRIRQEINKTIKDEITLRSNHKSTDKKEFNVNDIRELADSLEKEMKVRHSEQKIKVVK